MLSSVIVSNFITLPVLDQDPNGPYFVKNIDGLGPVDASVNTLQYSELDGEFPTGSNVGKRNIVLTLGINDPVETYRDLLYFWLMPKADTQLKFVFEGGKAPVLIDGIVESNKPNHFSQDPEVQISIICPDPRFRSEEVFTVTGEAGISPADTIINYNGNLIAGFDVELLIGSTNYGPDVIAIDFDHDFLGLPPGEYRSLALSDVSVASGRKVVFNTRPGEKLLESQPISSGVTNNLLYAMTSDSFWLTMWPGDNHIRVRTNGSDIGRVWTLKYNELFGGI